MTTNELGGKLTVCETTRLVSFIDTRVNVFEPEETSGAEIYNCVSLLIKFQVNGPAVVGAQISTPSFMLPEPFAEKVIILSLKQEI